MLKKLSMLKIALCLTCIFVLTGCANPHNTFYKDFTEGVNIRNDARFEISNSKPTIILTDNVEAGIRKLKEDGYIAIGESSYWAARDFSEKDALEYASQNGASVVLYYKKYKNSESTTTPLVLPNAQTSYNPIIGTTTTYGTQVTNIPITHHYYDYSISYWIKQIKFRLGLEVNDLLDPDKKLIGSNKGVKVSVVIKNTPAYDNEFLPGDILKKVNTDTISDSKSFYEILGKYEGKLVEISVIRDGKEIIKSVKVNKTS